MQKINRVLSHGKSLQTSLAIKNFHTTSLKRNSIFLNIEPNSCLQDEPVHIRASGLKQGQQVTITSSAKDVKGHEFFSHSHYTANSDGLIDLNTACSLGGDYEGLFPMGLIASLKPSPSENKFLRFVKRDLHNPNKIRFSVLKGHLDGETALASNTEHVLANCEHLRHFMAPGVERIPIKVGRVRGTLFLPPGAGPFPGIIDLFGSSGGLVEFRAAQFASRGIAALSLAYFGYDDLPKTMGTKDLAYFEEAALFLRGHEKVLGPHIGVVGLSIGGEIACAMGCYIECVKAVVCINGYTVNTWSPLLVNGNKMPFVKFRIEKARIINSDLLSSIDMLDDPRKYPETHMPLHESEADFLFHVSLDDQNYYSGEAVDHAVERMEKCGYYKFKVFKYPGAGHLLEPPYSPHCVASFFKMAQTGLLWGGSPLPHNEAQVKAWKETVHFIKDKLK